MTDIADRLRAAVADRYDLERELGAGGMATVYLARDRRQDRPVAMKVLRPELAASLGAGRFPREIAISARLAHPNILPLYDSGESDGFLWYTMPFVEGESLRERLRREKQLPLEDAVQIACETADALAHAHAHGFVHRDIKPENILLEAGHAVVADFGVARAITAAGTDEITRTGLAVGTPLYMSPEQAAGARDVDGRSDQYSLGCVLYEMLAGDPPFTASTPQAIIARKLNEPLPRISVVREVVPPHVEAAVRRSLARVPADRFRSMADFAAALRGREITAPTPAAAPLARGRFRRAAARTIAALAVLAAAAAAAALGRLALGFVRAPRSAPRYGDAPRWAAWKGWSGESFPVVAVAGSLLIVGPGTGEVEVFDGDRWTRVRVPEGFSLRPHLGPAPQDRLFAIREAGPSRRAAATEYWWLALSAGVLRPAQALPGAASQPGLPSWWSDGRDLVTYTHSIRRLVQGAWVVEPTTSTGFVDAMWGRDADHRFALASAPTDSLLVFDGIGWKLVDPLGGSATGRARYTAGATFGDGTTVLVGDECDAREWCRPLILEQDRFGGRWRRVEIPQRAGIPVAPRRDTGSCDSVTFGLTDVAGRSREDWALSGTWSACEPGRSPRGGAGCPPGQPCFWTMDRGHLRPVADLVGRQVAASIFTDTVLEALTDDGTLWRRVGRGWRAITRVPGLPLRLVGASQRLVVRATGGVVRYEPGRGDTLSIFFVSPLWTGRPAEADEGDTPRRLAVRDTTAALLTANGSVHVTRCRMVRIGPGIRDSELRCPGWTALPSAGGRVEAIAILGDGRIVGVGPGGLAVTWSDRGPTREHLPPSARTDSLWAVMATADGAATAIGTAAVLRRDARGTWTLVRPWQGPPNERGHFTVLPNGDLVTAGWAIRLWDRSSDTLPVRTLYRPAGSDPQVSALHALADGRLVAGLSSPADRILGGRLLVWADPARAGLVQRVDLPLDVDVTDLTDDGEYLYVAGRGGSLSIALDALPFATKARAP